MSLVVVVEHERNREQVGPRGTCDPDQIPAGIVSESAGTATGAVPGAQRSGRIQDDCRASRLAGLATPILLPTVEMVTETCKLCQMQFMPTG